MRISMVIALGVLVLTSAPSRADLLYSQPAASPIESIAGNDAATGFDTFEYFTIPQTSLVTSITWQGVYWDQSASTGVIPRDFDPSATDFALFLYSAPDGYTCLQPACDSVNFAGARLVGFDSLTPFWANETFAGFQPTSTVNESGYSTGPIDLLLFNYQDNLTTPLDLPAGGYLLDIEPLIPSQNRFKWYWAGGTSGDGRSFLLASNSFDVVPGDEAFTLSGSVVSQTPEPSSMPVLAIGALIIVIAKASAFAKFSKFFRAIRTSGHYQLVRSPKARIRRRNFDVNAFSKGFGRSP